MDIKQLREKTEDIFKTIEVTLKELQGLDEKKSEIEKYELGVRELEKKVNKKEEDLNLKEEELDKKEDGFTQKRKELVEYEKRLERVKNKNVEAGENIRILGDKIIEFKREQTILDTKRKEITSLAPKFKELERQQSLLAKEKAIDRRRKELLDKREEKVHRREKELQIEESLEI